jgi:hypothetical protein
MDGVMSSHSVRYMVICDGCKEMGDKRHMIPTDLAWWHGGCFITEFGEDRFMRLPASHVEGLTLNDIGAKVMKRWLDALPSQSDAGVKHG